MRGNEEGGYHGEGVHLAGAESSHSPADTEPCSASTSWPGVWELSPDSPQELPGVPERKAFQ